MFPAKLCVVLLFIGLAFSIYIHAEPTRLVCSTDNPKESLHVTTLMDFAERLKQHSEGDVIADVHYRGSQQFPAIHGEEVNMNLVMSGKKDPHSGKVVDVTVIASGNASLKAPILEFLMLPYIFPEIQAAKTLFQSQFMMRDINQVLIEKHGIRALGWLIGGYRQMTNSKRAVTRIEHIKGLKIRTPRNRLMRDTYLAFGAQVIALNWGETFAKLKAGVVDGQENPYNVIYYSKFWEANQKYVTKTAPFLWVGPILINEKTYQQFSPKLRQAFLKAGQESAANEWQWIEQKNEAFRKKLEAQKMTILDLEDKEKWVKASQKLWEKYYENIGYGNPVWGRKVVEQVVEISNSATNAQTPSVP
ncbi:TRAP transporter substrate-binding protein [Algicola sagamiensis]|uniref:TRAP transporter substrate-binding protein n=1 Tax=Algicola sagamiensis TaxID=163869 RepID=UPI0003645D70|nr:TRAP transporter substrate-binding protein [Algicola sagamiensis]